MESDAPQQGNGVLLLRWTSMRIPAGGLTFRLDRQGKFESAEVVAVEVTLDMWPHWLEIAIRHAAAAASAHSRVLEAHEQGNDVEVHKALSAEFQQSMQSISAAAFSLDALLGAMLEQSPPSDAVREAWTRNRTSRTARLLETARRVSSLTNEEVRAFKEGVGSVFRVRNSAVHPPRDFQTPCLHPDLKVGVDRRFVTYTAENAEAALQVCVGVVGMIADKARTHGPGRPKWADSYLAILTGVLEDNGRRLDRAGPAAGAA